MFRVIHATELFHSAVSLILEVFQFSQTAPCLYVVVDMCPCESMLRFVGIFHSSVKKWRTFTNYSRNMHFVELLNYKRPGNSHSQRKV